METFGSYLKAQREKKGIRLEEIASITKIHFHNLELLESGRWEQLPPEPFIRGFIIAYAKYVGIDSKEVIDRFNEDSGKKLELEQAASQSGDVSPQKAAGHRSTENANDVIEQSNPLFNRRFLLGSVLAVVLAVAFGITYIGKHRSGNDVATTVVIDTAPTPDAPAPEPNKAPTVVENPALTNAPATVVIPPAAEIRQPAAAPVKPVPAPASSETAATAKPTPEKPTAAATHEVSIEGKERTWIKVVIDGDAPVEYFLPKGERATYSAKNKIKVVLGNSTGTKVVHNGEVAEGVKFQGTIRSYIFPSEARFPQDPPKRATANDKLETTPPADAAPAETP
jgi:cytoskeleton protein RodZ